MTRKDYNLIAETIKRELDSCRFNSEDHGAVVLESLVARLAFEFQSDNHRFDTQRFETACGVLNESDHHASPSKITLTADQFSRGQ